MSPSEALEGFKTSITFVFAIIQNEPLLMMMLAGGLLAIAASVFETISNNRH